MSKAMPLKTVAIVAGGSLLCPFLSMEIKQFLYSLSLSIKDIIIAFLPLMILCLLVKASLDLVAGATKIVVVVVAMVCCSNFLATLASHYYANMIYIFDFSIATPQSGSSLAPLWNFPIPKLLSNDVAMILGVLLGVGCTKLCAIHRAQVTKILNSITNAIFGAIGSIIPVFILGFVIKMGHDGIISTIVRDYSLIFIMIVVAQATYIMSLYFILSGCNVKSFVSMVSNMLPAAISAFTTMSSAVSLPVTIVCSENNIKNKELARCILPVAINIHMLGDCLAIPMLAYAVLKSFGMPEPTLYQHVIFTIYFVLAKFSASAVPAGSIMVMLPVLSAHLGFNAEMISLITALYILFDPIATCANVIGNGAFVKACDLSLDSSLRNEDDELQRELSELSEAQPKSN